MCRIEDCEPATLHAVTERKAAKAYVCGDCGRDISVGERYMDTRMLSEGFWDKYRTCLQCWAAGKWLVKQCGGWLYNGIGEELREHWDEEYTLRSIGLARLVIGHRQRWLIGGALVPVERVARWVRPH